MHSTRQLVLVETLAQHRHFGRAAQALGLSQPAITKALKSLEEALGGALFERGPPVAPTALGRIVLDRARSIVAGFDDLAREIALAKGLSTGRLVIAAGALAAEFAVLDAVAALSHAHPHVSCHLRISDHLAVTRAVLSGEVDIGVAHVEEAERHDDLSVERLRRAPLVFFAAPSHPLAGRPADEIAARLTDFPWAGASPILPAPFGATVTHRPFGEVDHVTGNVTLRLQVNAFSALVRIVMHSRALAAAPRHLVAAEIAAGRLVALPAPPDWPVLDYGIILRRSRTASPAAEAWMAELRRLEAAIDAAAPLSLAGGSAT